jgi:tRNA nucleotidyltransferase (CCA-adding enzyme)
MQIVVTHDGADFDALASAVAAAKLYPGAQVALGTRLGRDVRDFVALHKDRLPLMAAEDMDARADEVERVILVDVRRVSRLAHVPRLRARMLATGSGLEVHVWDHHPASPDDVPAASEHVERVGSATTMLVEAIQQRGLALDAADATLFALGIHVDTGSLRYSGTTPRDAAALAWLLARGARLSIINRYLDLPWSDPQRRALGALLPAIRVEAVFGARVGLAELPKEFACSGLDEVTTEALALEDVHALVAAYAVRDGAVQLIARSRAPWIDVGALLREFGGGGHATAGAAVVRQTSARAVLDTVLARLRSAVDRPTRVEQIMSSPVHTAAADSSMAVIAEMLESSGHTGVPVLKDGVLRGIVSRRDLEAARKRGRERDPASHHMTSPVITIEPEATLDDALARMTSRDVGRLPVLRAGRLVGIVTRADVLAALYT